MEYRMLNIWVNTCGRLLGDLHANTRLSASFPGLACRRSSNRPHLASDRADEDSQTRTTTA